MFVSKIRLGLVLCFSYCLFFGSQTAFSIAQDAQMISQKPVIVQETSFSQNGQDIKQSLTQHNLLAKTLQNELKKIQEILESGKFDSETLDHLREKALYVSKQALQEGALFRAPLTDILFQIGQNNSDQKDKAPNFNQIRTDINALLSGLEQIYSNSYTLLEDISAKGHELFTRSLTDQISLAATADADIISQASKSFQNFSSLLCKWFTNIFANHFLHFIIALLLPLLLSFCIGHWSRKFLTRFTKNAYEHLAQKASLVVEQQAEHKPAHIEQPHFTVAFLSVFIPLISWILFFILSYNAFALFGFLNENIAALLRNSAIDILLILFFYRLARAVFAPKKPALQLITVQPSIGQTLVILITLLAAIIGFDNNSSLIFSMVNASEPLRLVKSLNTIFLANALIFAILFIYPSHNINATRKILGFPYWKWLLVILATVPSIFALLGYINLARYIMQQIVVGGAFLFFLYLGFITARHIALEGSFQDSFLGRILSKHYDISPTMFNQIGLALGFVIDFLVLIICIPAILVQLGFSAKTIYSTVISFLTHFQIGNISVSLLAIFVGILVFFVSLFVLRRFITWLDITIMARGSIDSGVRNSIKTVLGYIAFAVSILMGLSVAGFNLSSLAIVAGGLSLGIGFGLQNIVQNFVAGLIILVERPFKAGDYIEAGAASGVVKRINVRATEVETTKKETIIIPNSSFINSNVSNWTKDNLIGRVDIPLTIPAKKDPEEIYRLLLEALKECDDVLKRPAPYIAFTNFDNTNLTFTVSLYLTNILKPLQATNNVKYKIYRYLTKEGIFE